MTSVTTDPATTEVRTSVVVTASPQRAFTVFTEQLDGWWPRSHHLVKDSDLDHVAIEPGVGGRCFEVTRDGRTCTWGRVLSWDPPRTFSFSWEIQPDWDEVPPEGGPGSTVTVTFTPLEHGTHVEVVHSGLDVHGPGWEQMRRSVGSEGGWPGILRDYARRVETG